MARVKHRVWRDQLESARRERDEIEVKMYFDHCPWWIEDELRQELSWRLRQIEEAEIMLGLKTWTGGAWCESKSRVLRFIARRVEWFRFTFRAMARRLVILWRACVRTAHR